MLATANVILQHRSGNATTLVENHRGLVFFQDQGSARVCDSIIVLADNLQVKNSSQQFIPFLCGRVIWEQCGENDIKMDLKRGRMDPALKLYRNCPLMLPTNIDVSCGQANGTQALLQAVVLKQNEDVAHTTLRGGATIPVVKASQIKHVVLKHCNDRIKPAYFNVEPKQHSFVASVPRPHSIRLSEDDRENLKMRANQLPLLNNNATTGHKLQGKGVETLFVHSWSYTTNWVHVMLSRVKTIEGLCCRLPLSHDLRKYCMPQTLRNLISDFEQRQPTFWSVLDYERLFPADCDDD